MLQTLRKGSATSEVPRKRSMIKLHKSSHYYPNHGPFITKKIPALAKGSPNEPQKRKGKKWSGDGAIFKWGAHRHTPARHIHTHTHTHIYKRTHTHIHIKMFVRVFTYIGFWTSVEVLAAWEPSNFCAFYSAAILSSYFLPPFIRCMSFSSPFTRILCLLSWL